MGSVTLKRKHKRDESEERRRKLRREARKAQDALAGRAAAVPLAGRAALPAGAAEALAALGAHVEDGRVLLGPLQALRHGPVRVQAALGPAQAKLACVESPTWLALVRCMPCAICGRGISFEGAVALAQLAGDWRAGAQSEANHHPGKGPSGGGSDFLTHPACSDCHFKITNHALPNAAERCEQAVAQTHHAISLAIHAGKFQIAILVACAVEAFANAERS